MSIADKIFVDNLKDILSNGAWDTDYDVRPHWADGQKAHTVKKFCIVNRYDLSKEFPIITVRKTVFRNAVDELLWIWQKKSNNVNALHSRLLRRIQRLFPPPLTDGRATCNIELG